MRVQVDVCASSYVDLNAALEDMPARKRAERIRHLAALGLIAERGVFPEAQKKSPPKDNSKKIQQLKSRYKF